MTRRASSILFLTLFGASLAPAQLAHPPGTPVSILRLLTWDEPMEKDWESFRSLPIDAAIRVVEMVPQVEADEDLGSTSRSLVLVRCTTLLATIQAERSAELTATQRASIEQTILHVARLPLEERFVAGVLLSMAKAPTWRYRDFAQSVLSRPPQEFVLQDTARRMLTAFEETRSNPIKE